MLFHHEIIAATEEAAAIILMSYLLRALSLWLRDSSRLLFTY